MAKDYSIKIDIDERLPAERALKKFKRFCEAYGVIREYRKRQEYKKPSTVVKVGAIHMFRKFSHILLVPFNPKRLERHTLWPGWIYLLFVFRYTIKHVIHEGCHVRCPNTFMF